MVASGCALAREDWVLYLSLVKPFEALSFSCQNLVESFLFLFYNAAAIDKLVSSIVHNEKCHAISSCSICLLYDFV
jgi:hypothetical protein